MARRVPIPRKRRTREHVIASQSVNHVERLLIDEGHTAERVESDYGYDLILFTYDGNGYVEAGYVFLQLKATDALKTGPKAGEYLFPMSMEDYNLWRYEPMPVFFILYDALHRRAYWLYVQRYFDQDPSREPRKGAQSVRLHIPAANRLTRRTIRFARNRKTHILSQIKGAVSHD